MPFDWTDARSTWLFFSDGDTVEIRLGADGKTLNICDNHAVDESADSSATHQEPTQ
jgi:hypothetical protein